MLLLSSCLVPSLLSASNPHSAMHVASRPARSLYMMGKNEFHMMGKNEIDQVLLASGAITGVTLAASLGVGLSVAAADTSISMLNQGAYVSPTHVVDMAMDLVDVR